MPAIRGIGVVFGCRGVTYAGFADPGEFAQRSQGMTKESDKVEITDGAEVRGVVYYKLRRTFTVQVVPLDITTPTIAGAVATLVAWAAADPGTIITITDTNGPYSTKHGGKYLLERNEIATSETGEATVAMTIMMYDAYDVAVAVT